MDGTSVFNGQAEEGQRLLTDTKVADRTPWSNPCECAPASLIPCILHFFPGLHPFTHISDTLESPVGS